MPDVIDEGFEPPTQEDSLDARRADALVALASERVGADPDPDRATLVVHAELTALASEESGSELEEGPVLHPETARRLACDCRLQVVLEEGGRVLGIGRASRNVPPWLLRQVRRRDFGCIFPGCQRRRLL